MKQEQLHSMEPLWNHWYVEELLGEGSYGSVYRIKREDFGEVQYAALKVISIPQSEQQVRQCFSEGMGEWEVWQYFEHMVEEVYQEITLMAQLKGKSNIVSYEDHEIRKRTEGIGYDILIRMELLTSLEEYLSGHCMTEKEVIHMGKDLCQALCICGRHNIIHRDIKPANIFISGDGDFKLGDFGIARCMQECPKDLSVKGSYTYMAPEVYLGRIYDKRVDIYSLGIVLYTYLNQKYIPFIQEHITYENKTRAIKRRLGGEKIPKLSDVPEILADVIEKAVAYSPEERFLLPEEFLAALQEAEKSLYPLEAKEAVLDKTVFLASNYIEESDSEEEIIKKEVTIQNILGNLLDKSEFYKILALRFGNFHGLKSHICSGTEQIQKEKRKGKNRKSYKKKEEKRCWKRFYIHTITAALFFLFGGALLIAAAEGFGNFHVTSHAEEEKDKAVSVYAKEEEKTPAPILRAIPIENRKSIERNNSGINSIQKILAEDKCEQEEIGELYASQNQLTHIKELAGAVNLRILDVSGNKIRDFSPLSGLKELTICNVTGNPLENLSWLSGKEQLTSLWIGSTKVENLNELAELNNLQDLHIENTTVADLTPLANCKNLTQLECRNCENITEIEPLLKLNKLQFVSLDHTNVSKEEVRRLYQHMKKKNKDAYLIDVDGREYTKEES